MLTPIQNKKILLAHSNSGPHLLAWHERRRAVASRMGYRISIFAITEYIQTTIFPHLDKKWRKRDPELMRFYDKLGAAIDESDIFIHYNGAMIHPEFLDQFKSQLKIYHCADDPDGSAVTSQPVAPYYDICGISNPTALSMYRQWGCQRVFFWPLGAFHYDDQVHREIKIDQIRDLPLVFVGSKLGVTNVRFIGKYLGLYRKKKFLTRIENEFDELVAYGPGWERGFCTDSEIPELYRRARVGLNLHNSTGPINARLYDLAAFGVCQVCDNKATLDLVFEQGTEIIGYDNLDECVALLRHYLSDPDAASQIGSAARLRYEREYTMEKIWDSFFEKISGFMASINCRN